MGTIILHRVVKFYKCLNSILELNFRFYVLKKKEKKGLL